MKLLLYFFICVSTPSDTLTVTVVKVRDGDTIEVLLANGSVLPVRLHGVDSPDKCQDKYSEAKQFAISLLLNKKVKFVQVDTDNYERAVGEIFIDANNTVGAYGVWFNAAIVSAGYAWHWPRYSDSKELARLHLSAKALHLGVWSGNQEPTPPWDFRRTEKYKNCHQNY